MTRLHAVRGEIPAGGICAAYVVAALTGRPLLQYATEHVRKHGMKVVEMERHLADHGIRLRRHTLAKWVTGKRRWHNNGPMLWQALAQRRNQFGVVLIHNHALAFDGLLVMDTTSQRMQWVHDHWCARSRVRVVMEVVTGEPTP